MDTVTTSRRTARTAGIAGIAGGLIGLGVSGYQALTLPIEVGLLTSLCYVVLHLAAIALLGGLAALGAVGTAWWGRAGLGVAVLGLVVLIAGELVDPFDAATAELLFGIAPLLTGPGLVLAGIAVLRAGRWSGWRRIVPLVAGAYLLVVFVPVVIATGTDVGFLVAITGWDLALVALGVAVVQEASVAVDAAATPGAATTSPLGDGRGSRVR